jgi:hypothetical protein
LASFLTSALGFKHVLTMTAVWEHVCHEGFQRKKHTCGAQENAVVVTAGRPSDKSNFPEIL